MGSGQDTREKALELTGCITLRLLSRKTGVQKEDVIRALRRISQPATSASGLAAKRPYRC